MGQTGPGKKFLYGKYPVLLEIDIFKETGGIHMCKKMSVEIFWDSTLWNIQHDNIRRLLAEGKAAVGKGKI